MFLGSIIPLSTEVKTSGGTALLAELLLWVAEGQPDWMVLLLLMVLTMMVSDILYKTATTIVAAPVSLHLATQPGVSADPFLMALAISASAAFLTPIGQKNYKIILGLGRYRFSDYWRMGLPLENIVVAISMPLILVFCPL